VRRAGPRGRKLGRALAEADAAALGWGFSPFSFYFLFQKHFHKLNFCAQIISNQKQSSKT
jgi:hypothetical protein